MIVIDKSWLQGNSKHDIQQLAKTDKLLLCDILLYELTTENDNDVIQRCFQKIIDSVDSCLYIENVGGLLRYEIEHYLPSAPIVNKPFLYDAKKFIHKFQGFVEKGLNEEEKRIASEEKHNREHTELESDKFIFSSVDVWLPEINSIKKGDQIGFKQLQQRTANDSELIKDVYRQMVEFRPSYYPDAQLINENWAFFRRMQVHLISAIEYYRKYGVNNITEATKSFANDINDLEYCIIASLADGLATYDMKQKNGQKLDMGRFYKSICPNGILISRDNQEGS